MLEMLYIPHCIVFQDALVIVPKFGMACKYFLLKPFLGVFQTYE